MKRGLMYPCYTFITSKEITQYWTHITSFVTENKAYCILVIHLFQARHHLKMDPYNLFCHTKWSLMYPGYTFIPSKTSPNIGPI